MDLFRRYRVNAGLWRRRVRIVRGVVPPATGQSPAFRRWRVVCCERSRPRKRGTLAPAGSHRPRRGPARDRSECRLQAVACCLL